MINRKNEFELINETIRQMIIGPLYDAVVTYNGKEFDFPNLFTVAQRYNLNFQSMLLHANPDYVTTPDLQNVHQNKDRLSKYKAGQFIRDLNLTHECLPNSVSLDLYLNSGMLSLKAYSSNVLRLPYTKLDLPHEDIAVNYFAQNPILVIYCIIDTALCGDLIKNKTVREINLVSCYLIENLVCFNWDNIIQGKKTYIDRASNFAKYTNENFITPGIIRPKTKHAETICKQICGHFYHRQLYPDCLRTSEGFFNRRYICTDVGRLL